MNSPDNMPPARQPSDDRLHAALRSLPELSAPASLVSDVMAQIQLHQRAAAAIAASPWYRRPISAWAPALRVAFCVGSLTVIGAVAVVANLLWPAGASPASSGFFEQITQSLGTAGTVLSALGSVLTSLASQPLSPVYLAAGAVMLFSYFVLIGLGGTLWRVATRYAEQDSA